MLAKILKHVNRGKNIQATLDKSRFKDLEFDYSWRNLVRSYDLRMWYVQNAPHQAQTLKYSQELEKIHNELNYLTIRSWLFLFFLYFYDFWSFS